MDQWVSRVDQFGKPAWITLMVLGFIVFWPIGLGILAYMLWSGRMGCGRHGDVARWQQRMAGKWQRFEGGGRPQRTWSSGNTAFDEYRDSTLQRLEDESREFREFLERLRAAKDRGEFDQFMADRRKAPPEAPAAPSQS